jgi:elongation factor Ts
MSVDSILEKVKQLREITGVGFKDCKSAIDETKGDIEKSIELLRKKGIAKASKRMERVAAEGLICTYENNNNFSMIEINSETDFVAKNNEFINFAEEVCKMAFLNHGDMDKILNSEMENKKSTKANLVDLISKIG